MNSNMMAHLVFNAEDFKIYYTFNKNFMDSQAKDDLRSRTMIYLSATKVSTTGIEYGPRNLVSPHLYRFFFYKVWYFK